MWFSTRATYDVFNCNNGKQINRPTIYRDGDYPDMGTRHEYLGAPPQGKTLYDLRDCKITLSPSSYTYNGSPCTPGYSIKYDAGNRQWLTSASDLTSGLRTVVYGENINCDVGTLRLTGRNVQTDSPALLSETTVTFPINKAENGVSIRNTNSLGSLTKGEAADFHCQLNTESGAEDKKIKWSVASDSQVQATFSSDSSMTTRVTPTGVGTLKLKVDVTGMKNYKDCSAVYSIQVRYPLQTVLYKDGTMIINEQPDTRNSSAYGGEAAAFSPWTKENPYNGAVPWNSVRSQIKQVQMGESIAPEQVQRWFYRCYNLSRFDGTKLDFSKVTNMESMFEEAGTSASTFQIDGLSKWDTSKVKNMKYAFKKAGNGAQKFDIQNFTIPAGCDTTELAQECTALSGNITFLGTKSGSGGEFYKAVTKTGNRVLLSFNQTSEGTVDGILAQYGRRGSLSRGYIYKNAVDVILPERVDFRKQETDPAGTLSGTIQVENLGIPAKISQVSAEALNGWQLIGTAGTDFSKMPVDQKKINIRYEGQDLTSSRPGNRTMDFDGTATLDFQAKIGPMTTELKEAAFGRMVLTLDARN